MGPTRNPPLKRHGLSPRPVPWPFLLPTPSALVHAPVNTPVTAYVALGANLGEPIATLQAAAQHLTRLPGLQRLTPSSLYRTAPLGLADQPDFINAVVRLDFAAPQRGPQADPQLTPQLTPQVLLEHLFAIEAAFGRQRSLPNAPRTLDLDLLLYDQQSLASPTLTLPHPRMQSRAFVLVPLLEIAPECSLPGLGRASVWLAACQDQACVRLELPLLPDASAPPDNHQPQVPHATVV